MEESPVAYTIEGEEASASSSAAAAGGDDAKEAPELTSEVRPLPPTHPPTHLLTYLLLLLTAAQSNRLLFLFPTHPPTHLFLQEIDASFTAYNEYYPPASFDGMVAAMQKSWRTIILSRGKQGAKAMREFYRDLHKVRRALPPTYLLVRKSP